MDPLNRHKAKLHSRVTAEPAASVNLWAELWSPQEGTGRTAIYRDMRLFCYR